MNCHKERLPKKEPPFLVLFVCGDFLWCFYLCNFPLRLPRAVPFGQPSYQSLTPQLSRQSPLELGSSCLIVLMDGTSRSGLSKEIQFCLLDHMMLSGANQDATQASIESHVECIGVEDIAILIPSP